MDRGAETPPEASPKMTCRKRARSGQFLNGDISLEMRAQHFLGSELLPWFQAASGRDCKLWGAGMCLQGVGAKHRGNLVERQSIQRLPVFNRGENVFCYLCHNQIFDKELFPKLERRRHGVVERDPLKELPREVIMQIIEWAAHPHFHAATQIDECRGERYRSRDANASPVVNS